MLKKILLSFLILLIGFTAFSFYLSPRLGGLISLGKDEIDKNIYKLEFDKGNENSFGLEYNDLSERGDLVALREQFRLDKIVDTIDDDFEQVLAIQSWVQSQWEHDGDNAPDKFNAVYILEEAQKGNRFRCVEYSLVARECLAALGFKVRTIGLMTKDISEVKSGGGHVANEVYLEDLNKWMFIDPQFDVIAVKDGIPLNAVELQHAIAHNENFDIINPNNTISKEDYVEWIGPYLYYFYVTINGQRISVWDRIIGNKKQLTLLSKDAREPEYFQKIFKINNSYYTNSLNDFYPKINQ
ncbi:transglutaminase-like domain-containing protein [Mangrovivirga sp. M17]|uniref:Transglutaminase-like domain-containing protein n=1 Tax=Mangrovivirga halotolerans TaxID=2993936 RepID=A0ABT3RPA3_9BACT|nr:transglutaminase-like domain-containing protein [Mangrovivirga halotolerans]MCX2743173.1 transglutaminase-like domain-containing protein [Mangrovivirga halotolerans]